MKELVDQKNELPGGNIVVRMIWTQALASLNPGHTARVSITTLVYIFVTILSIPQSCVYTTTNSKIKCLQLNTRSEKINPLPPAPKKGVLYLDPNAREVTPYLSPTCKLQTLIKPKL